MSACMCISGTKGLCTFVCVRATLPCVHTLGSLHSMSTEGYSDSDFFSEGLALANTQHKSVIHFIDQRRAKNLLLYTDHVVVRNQSCWDLCIRLALYLYVCLYFVYKKSKSLNVSKFSVCVCLVKWVHKRFISLVLIENLFLTLEIRLITAHMVPFP